MQSSSLINWNDQKTKLKEKYKILTDADFKYKEGRKDEMFSRLQEILGKSREELTALISSL